MANGKAHAIANRKAAGGVAVVSIVGAALVHPVTLGLAFGAWFGCQVTPDRDHHVVTFEERQAIARNGCLGRLMMLYWWPYQKLRPHRGISHTWPAGSVERFLYGLWPLLFVSFVLAGLHPWLVVFWLFVFLGQSVIDIVHLRMDGM